MATTLQIDQCQRFRRIHRVGRNLRGHGDIFQRGKAGNQVIELEDKTDMVTPVARQLTLRRLTELDIAITHSTAGGVIQPAKNIQQG